MTATNRASKSARKRARVGLAVAAAAICAIAVSPLGGAIAQDLQSQLDSKRGELQQTEDRAGVLSGELARYTERVRQVAGEVAQLRNREAIVAERLEQVREELAAERDGDGWRLTGEKTWISNAPDADVYTVFARTTPDAGSKGVTAFAVPGDAEGLSGEPLELLATHAIGRLRFEAVRVGPDQVLGEVDAGFRVAMRTLDLFRPSVGAFAVGMAWAALDAAVDHAAEREAFGKPIKEFQAVSHALAEMVTRTEAARLLVYSAADAYEGGAPDVTRRSAMAKLFATETAQWVVDSAVQILGARALERGHLLEKLYREVRAPRIYEGTSEIQRELIARDLFR
jgi:acyl-CoA dehydrogenase